MRGFGPFLEFYGRHTLSPPSRTGGEEWDYPLSGTIEDALGWFIRELKRGRGRGPLLELEV